MTKQKKIGYYAALALLSLCFLVFSYSYLRVFGFFLLRRKVGKALLLILLWAVTPAAAAGVSYLLTRKPKYPPFTNAEGLPAYSNPNTYADAAYCFYPESKDYNEPARTPPALPKSKSGFARMSLLFGIFGCITPFIGLLFGCAALVLACSCRTDTEKKNARKDWAPDCRAEAEYGCILGACACVGQLLFCCILPMI
jgi:hypothetical protein